MQNIETIIFDLGAVIINLKTENEWIEEDLLPNFNPTLLHDLQNKNFFRNYETGKINSNDFIFQLKKIALNKDITNEEIITHWNGILKDIPAHRVDLLKELSTKYNLILLSNTNEIHINAIFDYMQTVFGENVLDANFKKCYYSQEVGLRKPDKEIYEYVLQHENLIPEKCLFLDDKSENLIEPNRLGIQTLLIEFNNLSKSTLQRFL